MSELIKITNLSKYFGILKAVDNINLNIEEGEVIAFLGPNGAGKSTTMKIISSFLSPSEGSVEVCGYDTVKNSLEVRTLTGFLPEGAPLYDDMTPLELLDFCAGIRGYVGKEKKKRIDFAVETSSIKEVLKKPMENLSKGFRRRIGIAQAILHDPDVLILDEPTDGLDPIQKQVMQKLIRDLAKEKKAVIISTHILEEVWLVCSRAAVISKGKLRAVGDYDSLRKIVPDSRSVEIKVLEKDKEKTEKAIKELDENLKIDVKTINENNKNYVLFKIFSHDILTSQVADLLDNKNIKFDELYANQLDMTKVFKTLADLGGNHA